MVGRCISYSKSTFFGAMSVSGSVITKNFRYLKWRNPEPEIRLFWGRVFPYISRIHTAYKGEDEPSILGNYLKCLVIEGYPPMWGGRLTSHNYWSAPLWVEVTCVQHAASETGFCRQTHTYFDVFELLLFTFYQRKSPPSYNMFWFVPALLSQLKHNLLSKKWVHRSLQCIPNNAKQKDM